MSLCRVPCVHVPRFCSKLHTCAVCESYPVLCLCGWPAYARRYRTAPVLLQPATGLLQPAAGLLQDCYRTALGLLQTATGPLQGSAGVLQTAAGLLHTATENKWPATENILKHRNNLETQESF
eukprot:3902735-Prymnesium_polylepis.1